MAKHLNKDPNMYVREHNAFLSELKQFHDSRGTPFRKVPCVNGKAIDLFLLYNEVTILGGWRKVNDNQKWEGILQRFSVPKGCCNGALALKQLYIRYLARYEKIHFLGEDPDDDGTDGSDNPTRKNHNLMYQVPLSYNHQQHEVSDALRNQIGMSLDFANLKDYEKLMLSLSCGLPNEVEFALNVCTLLSNEGRHTLRLEKAPKLLDLLVAQAGVWTEGNLSLKNVLEETWKKVDGRQMAQFWEDTVEDKELREIYFIGQKDKESLDDEESELFNLNRSLGLRDMEGQRVLQIATVLWNLSFEENNIPVLATSPSCLKFLYLCVHCKWCCLKQMGLDTLGNIAAEVPLDPVDDKTTQIMFKTITRSLTSTDRFLIIRGLEILTGLCKLETNDDIIIRSLDRRMYEQICSLLTIHDIMLLVYTLECLYYLTDLGHDICNNIVRIHRVIEILVSLLTVEAQSYGPNACISMKVVESSVPVTVTPAPAPVNPRPQPTSSPSVSQRATVAPPALQGYQEADNDTFAYNWLKAYYEWSASSSVPQNELYVDYQTTCTKLGKKGLVPPSQLVSLLRSLYPQMKTRQADSNKWRSEIHLDGIKRRLVPLPVSIYMPSRGSNAATNTTTTVIQSQASGSQLSRNTTSPSPSLSNGSSHSPILKAQLSAPPRTPGTTTASQHPHLQQALLGCPQPSATTPTKATVSSTPPRTPVAKDSTTLIKSLLANKVNQNMLLRQQQQQQTGSSQETVPGAVSEDADKKLKSPSTSPPKKTIPSALHGKSPKSRLNGAQRPVQLEVFSKDYFLTEEKKVCAHVEQAKDLVDNSEFHEARIERIENHLVRPNEENNDKLNKTGSFTNSSDATLDKLLRGNDSSTKLQNGIQSSLNGQNLPQCPSGSELPRLVTMEAATPLIDTPVRRKGVLADLLEGKVQTDALLSMNGIVSRTERSADPTLASLSVNSTATVVTAVSTTTSISTCVISQCELAKTSTVVSASSVRGATNLSSSNCNNTVTVGSIISRSLTNGESSPITKPMKIILPVTIADNVRIVRDVRTEANQRNKSDSADNVSDSKDSGTTLPAEWIVTTPTKIIVPPKSVDTEELIGFPRVSMEQLNQLRQQAKSLRAGSKRPSKDSPPSSAPECKKQRSPEEKAVTCLSSESSWTGSEEKASPILSPSEAQQQVSAVLHGSFSDTAKTPSMSGSQSSSTAATVAADTKVSLIESRIKNEHNTETGSQSKVTLKSEGHLNQKTVSSAESEDSEKAKTDSEGSTQSQASPTKLEFSCEWKSCHKSYASPMAVFVHACKAHAPEGSTSIPCHWENCDQLVRQRLSLMTHLQDRHCNDNVMKLQASRRHQLAQSGSSSIPPPPPPSPHPGYAPNAAVQAIRRHALEFLSAKEIVSDAPSTPKPCRQTPTPQSKTVHTDAISVLQEEKEGPVTKSIRLTAALILRNLVMYSSLGKSAVKKYEALLANIAMSNVESSRTVAQCLWELHRQSRQRVH